MPESTTDYLNLALFDDDPPSYDPWHWIHTESPPEDDCEVDSEAEQLLTEIWMLRPDLREKIAVTGLLALKAFLKELERAPEVDGLKS